MSKLYKILLGCFIAILALLVYTEATRPEPINWFPSYHPTAKIPLGTYALYTLLEEEKGTLFENYERPPFEILDDTTLQGIYFFINENISFDKKELNKLMNFAQRGNDIFIAGGYISGPLMDTLKLKIQRDFLLSKTETKPLSELVNPKLKNQNPYLLDKNLGVYFFKEIDTLHHTVLGVSQVYNDTLKVTNPKPNYIKAPVGKGAFYIHLQPEYFTNYGLVAQNTKKYVEGALAYINTNKPIFWDNYYKDGKSVDYSPLRVILSSKYLRWSYYFALIAIGLFVVFDGKRKQRSIPIIKPLTNKTVAFTETIASMYFDKKEYQKIAEKQIQLFLEYIRTQLRIPTEKIDKRFMQSVAARSGNSFEDTKALFTFIEKIKELKNTSSTEVEKLYKDITSFKQKNYGTSRNES